MRHPANTLRIFFSYCGRDRNDRHLVRHLLNRLEEQKLSPWIFERADGRIKYGVDIQAACIAEIDKSSLFLAFITDAAFGSPWTAIEVKHALEMRDNEGLTVIPIISTQRDVSLWPQPFAELGGIKGIRLRDLDGVESVVNVVCDAVGVPYRAPMDEEYRLPIKRRTLEEIREHRSRNADNDVGDFQDILRACDRWRNCYRSGDYSKAEQYILSVVTDVEETYGVGHCYYPRIVHGITKALDAGGNRDKLLTARKSFEQLIEQRNEWLDANAFAGAAYVDMMLGAFASAHDLYSQSEKMLAGHDPAAYYNRLLAGVLADVKIDVVDLCARVNTLKEGMLVKRPDDAGRFVVLYTLALFEAERYEDAEDLLQLVDPGNEVPFDVVVELLRTLADLAQRTSSDAPILRWLSLIDLLKTKGDIPGETKRSLNHNESWILFEIGRFERALEIMDTLMSEYPTYVRYIVDAGVFCQALWKTKEARECFERATRFVAARDCSPHIEENEFNYYVGLANWILGRGELAKEYHRKASGFGQWYHDVYGWLVDESPARSS